MSLYKPHTICRACGNTNLVEVFSLGVQPLANNFVAPGASREGHVPLRVMFCERCTLAQLGETVDPKRLYSNYSYVTSKSQTMKDHFEALYLEIGMESMPYGIVEIGSNDGSFLAYCRLNGATWVYGIEPAMNLASIAKNRGIDTFRGVFGKDAIRIPYTKPDVIVARHVFCHAGNWKGFVSELERASNRDTLVVIEVPYVLDTLKRCELDQLYHEHLSYLSLHAMSALLKDSAFHIHKVTRYEIHGGAIAIFLRRNDSGIAPHESAARMLAEERITINDWREFTSNACRKIHDLKTSLGCFFARKVCAFGASAKSTVWIQACGFTKDDIAFICDNTPQKQGCLSPGTDIPIVPESHLTRENADVCIVFCWNFMYEVRQKLKWFTDAGGVLVNPHEL